MEDPLCPVLTLKSYLDRTSNVKTGGLFIDHKKQTALSITQIRKRMLSLIRAANPDSFPKVHDIRKYATTLAFLNDAQFHELSAFTGWSSIRVFINHYRRELEDIRHTVVATGTVARVTPQH